MILLQRIQYILGNIDNFIKYGQKTDTVALKLSNSSVELPLWRGITLATFQISGNTPIEKQRLMMLHKGITIIYATTNCLYKLDVKLI